MINFDSPICVLEDVTLNLRRMNDRGNFKCSPNMFSITISQISPLCIVSFRIMPPFFTRYACDQIHTANFSIDQLYRTYNNLKRVGFTSTTFELQEHLHRLFLSFHCSGRISTWTGVPILEPFDQDIIAKVDYKSFVTIDIDQFDRLVAGLFETKAVVILTATQVMFTTPTNEIILTKQRKECIIGGIGAGEEYQFTITFYPRDSFKYTSTKRVWFFKPTDANGIIVIAPIGLQGEISSYFPRRLWQFV